MRLVVKGNPNLEIESAGDIARLIPRKVAGHVQNYGQGEGQFEFAETVWGVYVTENGEYVIKFEEGQCTWPQLSELVTELLKQIQSEFGEHLEVAFVGELHGQEC